MPKEPSGAANGASPADRAGLGALLRGWRERALLTQEQLADRTGLTARTIRRIESDEAMRPHGNTLRLLVTALGLSAAEQAVLSEATLGTPEGPPGGPIPRQLPAVPPAFTGRTAELADLDDVHDSSAVVITAIDGMAGIGKTALAVHAAHRLAGEYPDGQLFLDLHGYTKGMPPLEPLDALDRLLRALGVPGQQIPQHLDDRAALYRTRLADRKLLIVLDNAADEAQVRPLLPGTPGCLVLITSRRRLAGLDHTSTLSLDVLSRDDAVALFIHSAGEQRMSGAPPELVAEIVELCGRLPLAIRIAAARLRSRPSWTAAQLAELLRDHRRRLAELEAGHRSVTAALDLSYQQLIPEGQRAYRLFALHPGVDITAYAAAALLDTRVLTDRLIGHLLDAHLLQEPAPGRYRFHDLVRAHAIGAAASDEPESQQQAALGRLFDHYRHTAAVATDVAYPYERERRPRVPPAETPAPALPDPGHAIAWLDAELPTLLAIAKHAAHHGWPDHTLHLSATLHRHLRGRGQYASANTLHNYAVTVARATGDRVAEHAALTGLGHIRRLQGPSEQAVEHYKQALAVARAIGYQRGEMESLLGLGHAQRLSGQHTRAAAGFARGHEIARELGDSIGELDALTGLGWLHRQQGRYAEAVEDFAQARRIARDIGNRSGELDALTGLGWLHRQQGDHPQATIYFEQALDIARAIGNRHGEVNAMSGLGAAYRQQGQYTEAGSTYEQALVLSRAIGSRNLQFEVLQGLGRLHFTVGRHEDAVACHRDALDLAVQLRQPADEANAHDGLARAYQVLGQTELAHRHWRQALDLLDALGTDHTEDGDVTTTAIRGYLAESDQAQS